MQAYSVQFGGGMDQTILSPVVIVIMLLAIALMFALPRRMMVAPLLFAIFLVPQGQQLYLAPVHLFVSRILVLAAFIVAFAVKRPQSKHMLAAGWNSIDTAVVVSIVIIAVATVIRNPNGAAIVNQVGYLWDDLLGYLVLRNLIRDERDTFLAIKCIAGLACILATTMILEQVKLVNIFGLFGGVNVVPEIRDGKIRSQGVFQHSLTAGAFGATAIPLLILLWKTKTAKWFSIFGLVGAGIMTYTTQTSTSLMTAVAGFVVMFMWPLRKKMKMVRIGIVIAIVGLALVMKAPIWFIIAHIDLTGSSSNYQRAELIDQCVNHFSSWWLMGTNDVASWGWDMWDTQDMFVSTAESGGLAALILFILVISRSFSRIGKARKRAESKKEEWFFWLLGAALFAHMVAFIGVNYFDQSRMVWFALISIICACTAPALGRNANGVPARVRVRVQVTDSDHSEEQVLQPGRFNSGAWTRSMFRTNSQ